MSGVSIAFGEKSGGKRTEKVSVVLWEKSRRFQKSKMLLNYVITKLIICFDIIMVKVFTVLNFNLLLFCDNLL